MSIGMEGLTPQHPACRITVVIPARDEAALLGQALTALTRQVATDGSAVRPESCEIIIFANNCRDGTAALARARAALSAVPILVVEGVLPAGEAHIGAARRLVMDLAAQRFIAAAKPEGIIASTDADTVVDADWIAMLVREARGVDAVAGHVEIAPADQQRLLAPVRLLYARELTYRRLLAEIEASIDPRPEDPLPRHAAFVGANFAVRAQTYLAAGGLPPLRRLEDREFCRALRRIDARIRFSTRVHATTSERRCARVDGGFGSFIADLHACAERGESFLVEHPQATLDALQLRAALRDIWAAERGSLDAAALAAHRRPQRDEIRRIAADSETFGRFHERVSALRDGPTYRDTPVEFAIDALRAAAARLSARPPSSADELTEGTA